MSGDRSDPQPLTDRERALVSLTAYSAANHAQHAAVCSFPGCPHLSHRAKTLGEQMQLVLDIVDAYSKGGQVEFMVGTWERDPDEWQNDQQEQRATLRRIAGMEPADLQARVEQEGWDG